MLLVLVGVGWGGDVNVLVTRISALVGVGVRWGGDINYPLSCHSDDATMLILVVVGWGAWGC